MGGAHRDGIITSTAALKMFSNLADLYLFHSYATPEREILSTEQSGTYRGGE